MPPPPSSPRPAAKTSSSSTDPSSARRHGGPKPGAAAVQRIDFPGSPREQYAQLMAHANWIVAKHLRRGILAPIVFDIDDTLVDHKDRPIREVVAFFHRWKDVVPIYLVTARPRVPGNERLTREMLHENGIRGYRALYLRRSDEDVAAFKWRKRIDIARICHQHPQLTIGDQNWDALPHPVPRGVDKDLMHGRHEGAVVKHESGCGEVGILLPA